jgi:hypothetical protein
VEVKLTVWQQLVLIAKTGMNQTEPPQHDSALELKVVTIVPVIASSTTSCAEAETEGVKRLNAKYRKLGPKKWPRCSLVLQVVTSGLSDGIPLAVIVNVYRSLVPQNPLERVTTTTPGSLGLIRGKLMTEVPIRLISSTTSGEWYATPSKPIGKDDRYIQASCPVSTIVGKILLLVSLDETQGTEGFVATELGNGPPAKGNLDTSTTTTPLPPHGEPGRPTTTRVPFGEI